jgi:GAF domain-containing protein
MAGQTNSIEIKLAADVAAVKRIAVVPAILEAICRTTGMGFATIARVTSTRWIACAVRDEIQFGLIPGGELQLDTTICQEIQQNGKAVVIDHVAKDVTYRNHHTPAVYGFQSYISVPIRLKTDTFFGTLCAIDPQPSLLNTPEIIGMFKLFAELISFHLEASENLSLVELSDLDEQMGEKLRTYLLEILNYDLHNPERNAAPPTEKTPDKRSIQFVNLINNSSMRIKTMLDELKNQQSTAS